MIGWDSYEHFANAHGYGDDAPGDSVEHAEAVAIDIARAWDSLLIAFERCQKFNIGFDKDLLSDLLSMAADTLPDAYQKAFDDNVRPSEIDEDRGTSYDAGRVLLPETDINAWLKEVFK